MTQLLENFTVNATTISLFRAIILSIIRNYPSNTGLGLDKCKYGLTI